MECLRIANRQLPVNALAFAGFGTLFTVIFRDRAPLGPLLAWYLLVLFSAALSSLTSIMMERRPPTAANIAGRIRVEALGMFLFGFTWGITSFIVGLNRQGSERREAILLAMVFQLGAACAGLASNASVRQFFLALTLPLGLLPAIRGLTLDDPLLQLMGAGSLVFLAMICAYHWELHRYVTSSIRFRYEVETVNSHLVEAMSTIEAMSRRDDLTGLHNRRHFLAELDRAIVGLASQKRRGDGAGFCVALLDIDYFKQINDTLGHAVGDDVLVGLTGIISQLLRSEDCFGRLGGEEFGVVLAGATFNEAMVAVDRLRMAVAEAQLVPGRQVTVSAGVVEAVPGTNGTALLAAADRALYAAKAAGRNRVMAAA